MLQKDAMQANIMEAPINNSNDIYTVRTNIKNGEKEFNQCMTPSRVPESFR